MTTESLRRLLQMSDPALQAARALFKTPLPVGLLPAFRTLYTDPTTSLASLLSTLLRPAEVAMDAGSIDAFAPEQRTASAAQTTYGASPSRRMGARAARTEGHGYTSSADIVSPDFAAPLQASFWGAGARQEAELSLPFMGREDRGESAVGRQQPSTDTDKSRTTGHAMSDASPGDVSSEHTAEPIGAPSAVQEVMSSQRVSRTWQALPVTRERDDTLLPEAPASYAEPRQWHAEPPDAMSPTRQRDRAHDEAMPAPREKTGIRMAQGVSRLAALLHVNAESSAVIAPRIPAVPVMPSPVGESPAPPEETEGLAHSTRSEAAEADMEHLLEALVERLEFEFARMYGASGR
jgi:hypothetical protein